jgi:hypothetical protein
VEVDMRLSIVAVLALLSLTACASSGRIVVAKGEPAPPPPPPPHRVQGPVLVLGIPPGHYPPPGQCRVWIPGRPPGHQPAPCACYPLANDIPPGAWVLYRPVEDETIVEVTDYDDSRPNVVLSVSWYDAGSGKFVRSEKGSEHSEHGKGKHKGKKH